jgi:hypothetical protein
MDFVVAVFVLGMLIAALGPVCSTVRLSACRRPQFPLRDDMAPGLAKQNQIPGDVFRSREDWRHPFRMPPSTVMRPQLC